MTMVQLEGRVWVASHGLQLVDVSADWNGAFTNQAAFDDAVGIAPGVVGVTDISRAAGQIPVIVELYDAAPSDDDIDDYDGVIDAPFEAKSGILMVQGDVDTFEEGLEVVPTLRFAVPAGSYRVRVSYANNDTSTYDYANGADHVRLSLWPSAIEPLVKKKAKKNEDDPVKEYRGARSKEALMKMLGGPSISHRCLAVVALARLGAVGPLTDAMAKNKLDSVRRVYLASLGFAGEKGLEAISEQSHREDRDLKLRMVQALKLVGGDRAKEIASEIAEGSSFDMLTEAVGDVE